MTSLLTIRPTTEALQCLTRPLVCATFDTAGWCEIRTSAFKTLGATYD